MRPLKLCTVNWIIWCWQRFFIGRRWGTFHVTFQIVYRQQPIRTLKAVFTILVGSQPPGREHVRKEKWWNMCWILLTRFWVSIEAYGPLMQLSRLIKRNAPLIQLSSIVLSGPQLQSRPSPWLQSVREIVSENWLEIQDEAAEMLRSVWSSAAKPAATAILRPMCMHVPARSLVLAAEQRCIARSSAAIPNGPSLESVRACDFACVREHSGQNNNQCCSTLFISWVMPKGFKNLIEEHPEQRETTVVVGHEVCMRLHSTRKKKTMRVSVLFDFHDRNRKIPDSRSACKSMRIEAVIHTTQEKFSQKHEGEISRGTWYNPCASRCQDRRRMRSIFSRTERRRPRFSNGREGTYCRR